VCYNWIKQERQISESHCTKDICFCDWFLQKTGVMLFIQMQSSPHPSCQPTRASRELQVRIQSQIQGSEYGAGAGPDPAGSRVDTEQVPGLLPGRYGAGHTDSIIITEQVSDRSR